MSSEAFRILKNVKIRRSEWTFSDLRIDIPPLSFGSDAANPHTQYSNAVACMASPDLEAFGITFTLGAGNEYVCDAASQIVSNLDGNSVGSILSSQLGFAETLVNPIQIRWLSPWAGVPMMAAGLVANTILDAASKRAGMPAWEFLARLETEELLSLMSLRHLPKAYGAELIRELLTHGERSIGDRCEELRQSGLPVYFTTWIGHSSSEIIAQARSEIANRGITQFKVKIDSDVVSGIAKLTEIKRGLPEHVKLCVDANQTLSFDTAVAWLRELSQIGCLWLEEPFAPDNVTLFAELAEVKRRERLSCEIATGENCPNTHTAAALLRAGVDRFQADPCRMLGLVDGLVTACLASLAGVPFTPHAGGAGLDELSVHLQLLNLARVAVDAPPSQSLTENVGFCSHLYSEPTVVARGIATPPERPGFLVGLADEVRRSLRPAGEGPAWVAP